MKRTGRPRIADVAKLAGTSETAVSAVLNNRVGASVRVSEDTQKRIWDAVRKLGYSANPIARKLIGGHNCIIGVFTFEATFPIEFQNFYYPFLVGIEQEAAAQGYDLLLFASASDASGRRSIYRDGVNRLQLADGAILLGLENSKDEVLSLLAENFPFVFVGRRESPEDNISYVAADYVEATAQLVHYLFQHDHRTILYLRSLRQGEASQDRAWGFQLAHERAGLDLPPGQMRRGEAADLSADEMRMFLECGVTAFAAEDDELAERLLHLARDLNLNCPDDFSLVVLGDPLTPADIQRNWTSFKIPRLDMGREAVRLLLRMFTEPDAPKPLRIVLPCTFVPGNTVARPPVRKP